MSSPSGYWIDISASLQNGMVHWPGDPEFHIERAEDQARGDPATVSKMSLGVHTGTHMDAPLHYIQNGVTIDDIPLDACVGRARVIEIRDSQSIKAGELEEHLLASGERILFKTANSDHAWSTGKFEEDFVYIAQDAARYLAQSGVLCVGIDYLSVGGFRKDGPETHQALLEAGVWIIEGLNLSGIEPGEYELVCLPLKLVGADGAPARAILRSLE